MEKLEDLVTDLVEVRRGRRLAAAHEVGHVDELEGVPEPRVGGAVETRRPRRARLWKSKRWKGQVRQKNNQKRRAKKKEKRTRAKEEGERWCGG